MTSLVGGVWAVPLPLPGFYTHRGDTVQTVLLSGKQGSGKTTIQKKLAEDLANSGHSVVLVNFADELYKLQNIIYDRFHKMALANPDNGHEQLTAKLQHPIIVREIKKDLYKHIGDCLGTQLYVPDLDEVLERFLVFDWKPHHPLPPVKDGELLQFLGTEWGRKTFGENIWVQLVDRKLVKNSLNLIQYSIIGDTRFENEFDYFPSALRVRLHCYEEIRKLRCSYWRGNTNHPSEVGLDQYEATDKFDLVFDTFKDEDIPQIVGKIRETLAKKSWHYGRTKRKS